LTNTPIGVKVTPDTPNGVKEDSMKGTKFWANVTERMGYMRMADLARVTGLKMQNIRALRRRGSIPPVDQCYLIATALGCKVDDLIREAVPV
jgi:DNA-binding Xre family transcriptional regulator